MDEQQTAPDRPAEPVILEKPGHPISHSDIDPDVLKILFSLHRQGFIAYLTGGAVRDMMLGKHPKDFDVVTDARPGQIKKRFRNVYVIGRRFRLAHIHFADGKIIEVSTFRSEAEPFQVNSPEAVIEPKSVYGTPREDAFRRDITINALYYDPVTFSVIDYVGGLEDLARRRVRVIGNPAERFTEDPVRIWRVIRHAARLGFDIEEATEQAILSHRPLLAASPGARLYEELNKDLAYETRPVFEALRKYSLLRYILGRIGEDYEAGQSLFSRLSALLEVEDRAKSRGFLLSLEEMHALIFWPWAEPLLAGTEVDPNQVLKKAFLDAQMRTTIPRNLKANVIQIMIILSGMIRAIRTGHMRWSLQKRSHYDQASRLFFLIEKGRAPEEGESFEGLFKEAFPLGTKWRRRRRRRFYEPNSGDTDQKS
jgi:poly(A) polymerase